MDHRSCKDLRHTSCCLLPKDYQNMKQQINNLLFHYEDKCNFQLFVCSKCEYLQIPSLFYKRVHFISTQFFNVLILYLTCRSAVNIFDREV
jgi:hypothetical protein